MSRVRVRDTFIAQDLTIRPGVITVLRGPSGCGKTTALRILNRMTPIDEGELRFRGSPIDAINPISLRREVVMLSQHPVLFADSLWDDLPAGCRFAERPDPETSRLKEALAAVRLSKSLDADPSMFSGGEKQRLALARVLLMDPEVLLLDEPSSGLDRDTEEAVFGVIRLRQEAGKSVIVATHARDLEQMGAVEEIVFSGGRLERARRQENAGPLSARSAGLLDSEDAGLPDAERAGPPLAGSVGLPNPVSGEDPGVDAKPYRSGGKP